MKNLRGELEKTREEERTITSIMKESRISCGLDEWRLQEELLWMQGSRVE